MSKGLLIALLLGFALIALLMLILLFWFAREEEKIKGKQVTFYTLLATLVASGVMMLGVRPFFQDPRIGAILLLIILLVLGVIHSWIISLPKTYLFSSKLIHTIALVFVSAFVSLLLFYFIGDQSASYQYLIGYAFLIVPLITQKAFDVYFSRPPKWYPTTMFQPGYEAGPIDFTMHQPLKVQFRLDINGAKQIFKPEEFPNGDPLKWVIYSFWVDHVEDELEREVEKYSLGKKVPFGWLFFVKPFKFWPFKRIVDPDKSLIENRVPENYFLILKRRLQQ